MAEAAPAIGSMWWSGIARLRARGIPARMVTPVEGCRGWFGGLGLARHVRGAALDAAYDYINWWLDGSAGALMARNGAYMANPQAVRRHLSADEWAFWYEGAAARGPIRDPEGHVIFAPGERREGGSYAERMSRVVVWDAVMEEHNYLVRRWESQLAG
jgi:putative spermidine/putrescine transport system substrate-binding protein